MRDVGLSPNNPLLEHRELGMNNNSCIAHGQGFLVSAMKALQVKTARYLKDLSKSHIKFSKVKYERRCDIIM